ncbi:MAG: aminotransferase class I/II-fold pyridoxal phosphate-dependent enzyme [Firmicutes bacterium]|nr:aminotransferase class I/II-fold pyridoxal phosphate-dependent enzyme [Bacillota bacterium]
MKKYTEMTNEERKLELEGLQKTYKEMQGLGLHLDMSRGKPDATQLNLSMDMLQQNPYDLIYTRKHTDVRNYGELAGVDEAKELFADLLGLKMENIIMGGQSSLALMYDTVIKAYVLGVYGGSKPWGQQGKIKFLCPVPGYDRHFLITQEFGIEMINIPMLKTGPDMAMVKEYVENDPSVKGIWCVPKYSNPTGVTYSPETVEAFAALKPAADEFRIFWDNAYFVHGFREKDDKLVNIFNKCKKYGSQDMVYEFMSTSKVTFSGAGVAVLAASKDNIQFLTRQMSVQTLGYDKINQLRHVKYFKDVDGLKAHMQKQANYLRPKFDVVLAALNSSLKDAGIGDWTNPRGGYFINYDGLPGTAKRCVELCEEAGVKLTPAGSCFPYGIDPEDKNIRIAPSYPSTPELYQSMNVFCVCQKIAALEILMNEHFDEKALINKKHHKKKISELEPSKD